MTTAVDNSTLPPTIGRAIARGLTIFGVGAAAWLAFSLTSAAQAQTPLDVESTALDGVSISVQGSAGDAGGPVNGTVGRVADPVVQRVEPVVPDVAAAPVIEDVEVPIADAAKPIADAAEPIADQVVDDYAAPVLDETLDLAGPALSVGANTVTPIIGAGELIASAPDTVAEITAPVVDLSLSGLTAPVPDVAAEITVPVVDLAASDVTAPLPGSAAEIAVPAVDLTPHVLREVAPIAAVESPIGQSVAQLGLVGKPIESKFANGPVGAQPGAGAAVGDVAVGRNFATATLLTAPIGWQTATGPAALTGAATPAVSDPPIVPGTPNPIRTSGCPGTAGGTGGSAGSQLISLTGPADSVAAVSLTSGTELDHAAVLLSRANEPGTSPA
jgi:hypothetical protein